MNILLIHQYFLEENDPGGSRWNEITKIWSDGGHKITVLAGMMHYNGNEKSPEYKGLYFKQKQQGKVSVLRCHVSEAYNKNFIGRVWGYFSFMFSSIWAGLFKSREKYDVIIVTSPPLFVGLTAYIISKVKSVPFLFEVRDLWPESAIDTGVLTNKIIIKLAYWFEGFMYRKAKLINVLTPAFYNTLKNEKKVPEAKLVTIPNASDFNLSESLLQTFDVEEFKTIHDLNDKFVIIYVGAHGIANHLEQLLEAGKVLEDTNVLFLLIGQGMEKDRLKDLSTKMKVTNVRFLDSVSKQDIFKFILASDMGISVLKKVETFKTVYSNKTFDYMSCKKPILMAIDGISRALIEDSEAGAYIEPENIQAYNRIIREYLNDADRLKTEGENGYRFARLNFDRTVLSQKYISRIQQMIADK
jgi:glycosyltransferase involved in cell wall biosynthesis